MRSPSDGSATLGHGWDLVGVAAVAMATRSWAAIQTHVPDWDGVHYLWMAQRAVAEGPSTLFDAIFHPLYPALIAVVLVLIPGVDPQAAGQGVSVLGGGVAAALVFVLTRRMWGRGEAWAASLLFSVGTWFVRHPVDVLSEGVFLPTVLACVVVLTARARPSVRRGMVAGALGAAAFAARPEGAVLPAVCGFWLALRREVRAAAALILVASALVLAVMAGWAAWGPGWVLSSKFAFVVDEGVGRGGAWHYARQLVRVPSAMFEGLGVGLVLALWGWRVRRAIPVPSAVVLLGLPLAAQCLVAPVLKSHFRFFVGYGALVLPFAGRGFVDLWERARAHRQHAVAVVLVALAFAPDLIRIAGPRRAQREVERQLGRWLAAQGVSRGELFTDMPRVAYYAGLEPSPPRRWRPGEAALAVGEIAVRWVVVVAGRSPEAVAAASAAGFLATTPDERVECELIQALGERGIALYRR